jgi:hypothetical protein
VEYVVYIFKSLFKHSFSLFQFFRFSRALAKIQALLVFSTGPDNYRDVGKN